MAARIGRVRARHRREHLLAIAALTALPRLRMRLRPRPRTGAVRRRRAGVLKTLGRIYVQRTEANPAYQVVTGAVAVLVFLSLLNQFILFAAALTATSTPDPSPIWPPVRRPPGPPPPKRPARTRTLTGSSAASQSARP